MKISPYFNPFSSEQTTARKDFNNKLTKTEKCLTVLATFFGTLAGLPLLGFGGAMTGAATFKAMVDKFSHPEVTTKVNEIQKKRFTNPSPQKGSEPEPRTPNLNPKTRTEPPVVNTPKAPEPQTQMQNHEIPKIVLTKTPVKEVEPREQPKEKSTAYDASFVSKSEEEPTGQLGNILPKSNVSSEVATRKIESPILESPKEASHAESDISPGDPKTLETSPVDDNQPIDEGWKQKTLELLNKHISF